MSIKTLKDLKEIINSLPDNLKVKGSCSTGILGCKKYHAENIEIYVAECSEVFHIYFFIKDEDKDAD